MPDKKIKHNNDKGEIMIESMLVILITTFVLIFVIGLGFLLFQQWNMNIIANDTATKIAQTYKLTYSDPIIEYTNTEDLGEITLYRYMINAGNLVDKNGLRADSYAYYRLSKTSLITKIAAPKIEAEIIEDGVSRRHLSIGIMGQYEIPFGQVLELFGINGSRKYTASGAAECYDIMDYMNTVDFIEAQTSLKWTGSKIVSTISTFLKLFNGHDN